MDQTTEIRIKDIIKNEGKPVIDYNISDGEIVGYYIELWSGDNTQSVGIFYNIKEKTIETAKIDEWGSNNNTIKTDDIDISPDASLDEKYIETKKDEILYQVLEANDKFHTSVHEFIEKSVLNEEEINSYITDCKKYLENIEEIVCNIYTNKVEYLHTIVNEECRKEELAM